MVGCKYMARMPMLSRCQNAMEDAVAKKVVDARITGGFRAPLLPGRLLMLGCHGGCKCLILRKMLMPGCLGGC